MDNSVAIREMTRPELDVAVEWAAREGWNPGLDDAEAFHAADPSGYLVAEHEGEVLGTISAVRYGADYGFIGFYIVRSDLRGHRHGLLLAEGALERLAGRRIGIDGVLNKQRQYAKFFGFEFAGRNIRFGGVVPGSSTAGDLTDVRSVSFAEIAAYDRRFFPASRENFLRAWLAMPHAAGCACMRDGVRGYGVIRKCRQGFKIGPLFADDAEIAENLFAALCAHADGQPIYLDVPEVNAAAMALAARHGMKEVFATARMYRGGIPELPLDGIFGVTTFELG
jgi:hypothetical protein